MILVLAIYVGEMKMMSKYRRYFYNDIVKIVGYKIVNKYDNGQISLGKLIEIFDKKLQEENSWTKN